MNSLAELARLIENTVRFGTVAEVQYTPPRVRVRTGELLTTWLPWLAWRAGESREWDPPTINEQVILLSPSGQLANGVVITGVFSDLIPANGDRAGLKRRTYADGAVVEYDSVAHHLRAVLPAGGTSEVISDGGIRIVGDIVHEGNYTQTGNQKVTGKVEVTEDVVAAGISLVLHKHAGVMPGPGQTGSPVK
ncbi:phage baseplate assembly protein V [Pseudomonas sp. UBA2311]|uniref:phage baseplate assembly protein V n=1 Tax=Pseudomonas sp. UBA2311 TaxID=1947308 RepID=UPI00257C1050|nr:MULTISPECIES: phage baseplate assembly protein V [Pseudomonas]